MNALNTLIEQAAARGNALPGTRYRGMARDWSFAFEEEDGGMLLVNEGGSYSARPLDAAAEPTLHLRSSAQNWAELAKDKPAPGFQTLYTLALTGQLELHGDLLALQQYILSLELMLGTLPAPPADLDGPPQPEIETVQGRYLNLSHQGKAHRIYFEEAGSGIPLLCLHTAGADGRQYRGLLNDPAVTDRFRVIVFDLPMHGKSSLYPGNPDQHYRLNTDDYVALTMAMVNALDLDRPVVMGCSIGGRAVLHLALRHGASFRAAIGLQSALQAHTATDMSGSTISELWRPDVNSPEVSAAAVAAITAPTGDARARWETLWYYMQGGPGVFLGDLYYYFVDGDLRNIPLDGLRDGPCPLYLLTGEYDCSATPEMTRELAEIVAPKRFEVMKDLGHFPMSENYPQFREYLLPVLQDVAATGEAQA
ncbi:MAG: alpha/beta hydrolase [Pseudomonadota bacterium]